ncbi:MAG TPA: enoyl-CoA hydratase-related protein [Gammaproteobacteria bacterium]|nr:enoyl-CoA hydratase-related protein [Gammaproteobacteria bacterium]
MTNEQTDSILCRIESDVAHVILNRPDKSNALDIPMILQLNEVLANLRNMHTLRVLWLKGAGKNFCAGADLQWMQESIHFDKKQNYDESLQLAQLMYNLYTLPFPSLVTVQGACFGGGVGLVASCKIALATPSTKFCFSEAKLGLIPAVISPYILQALGVRATEALFLTSEMFNGTRAHELGLIQKIVEDANLESEGKLLSQILTKQSPLALKAIRDLVDRVHDKKIAQDLIEETSRNIAEIRVSSEAQEGVKAFLDKRIPKWVQP